MNPHRIRCLVCNEETSDSNELQKHLIYMHNSPISEILRDLSTIDSKDSMNVDESNQTNQYSFVQTYFDSKNLPSNQILTNLTNNKQIEKTCNDNIEDQLQMTFDASQNVMDQENVMKENDFERHSQDYIELQRVIEASLKHITDEIFKGHSDSEKEQDDYVSKSGLVSSLVDEMISESVSLSEWRSTDKDPVLTDDEGVIFNTSKTPKK